MFHNDLVYSYGFDLALGRNDPIDMNGDISWVCRLPGRSGTLVMCILSFLGRTYKVMTLHDVKLTCA